MDASWVAAIIAVLSYAQSRYTAWRQSKLERENQIIWEGKIGRGFAEAMGSKFMKLENGVWIVTAEMRMWYDEKLPDFHRIYAELQKRFRRVPTPNEFAWVVERTESLQTWLIDRICMKFALHDLGCMAIAYVLSSQYEAVK